MKQQFVIFAVLLSVLILLVTGFAVIAKYGHQSDNSTLTSPASLLSLPTGAPAVLGKATNQPRQNQAVGQADLPGAIEINATESSQLVQNHKVLVTLTSGKTFVIQLYDDLAPKTVNNFLMKVQNNFYTGLLFFRVDKDQQGNPAVVQTGDPTNTGQGGGVMQAEYNQRPFTSGSVGIARGQNRDKNSDSQFFIALQPLPNLTDTYTNFGEVVNGLDVVESIKEGQPIRSIQILQ